MGKRPFAGVIGLLGVSVFLTGCNCCKQDKKQAFMNDRADSSLGVTKGIASPGWNNKAQSSAVATNTGATGNPNGSTTGTTTGRSLDSAGASGTSLGSGMNSGMGGNLAPASSNGTEQPNNNSSLPGTTMSNPPGGGASLMSGGSSLTSLTTPGAGGKSTISGDIRPANTHLSDSTSTTTADYKATIGSVDSEVQQATMRMNDTGRSVVPPPPEMPGSLTNSPSGTSSRAIKPYPPAPEAPPSTTTDPALNNPPPATAGASPTIPGSGPKSSYPPFGN